MKISCFMTPPNAGTMKYVHVRCAFQGSNTDVLVLSFKDIFIALNGVAPRKMLANLEHDP